MRKLFLDHKDHLIQEACQPMLEDDMVLISIHQAFLSNDASISEKIDMLTQLIGKVPEKVKRVFNMLNRQKGQQFTYEHTCVGTIVSIGRKVRHFGIGEIVCCFQTAYEEGNYIAVPMHQVISLSKLTNTPNASLIPIAASMLSTMRTTPIHPGDYIGILGMGLKGQLIAQWAKSFSNTVIAIDINKVFLEKAKLSGAHYTFNLSEAHDQEISLCTQQKGLSILFVIEPLVSFDRINQWMKPKGTVVTLDLLTDDNTTFKSTKELSVVFARNQIVSKKKSHERLCEWEYGRITCQAVKEQRLIFDHLIDRICTIEEVNTKNKKYSTGTFGLLIDIAIKDQMASWCETELFVPAATDGRSIGFIGINERIQKKVIPFIEKQRYGNVRAIYTHDARYIPSKKDSMPLTIHEQELFNPAIDTLIISSQNKHYFSQILQAIEHKKALFLERPVIATEIQLQELNTQLIKHNVPFCVNYFRSFSPFITKIKEVTEQRQTPLILNYRYSCPLPKDQTVRPRAGVGRIISEASHIIDLFDYLIGAPIASVCVESLHAQRTDIFPTDNFSTILRFTDGSICTLTFTTLAHPDLGRERMEIYFDNKSILLEDYQALYGFGLPSWFNETLQKPNNGYEALLLQFFDALSQKTFRSPVGFNRFNRVAKIALSIDKLVCYGGGKVELSQ